MGHRRRARSERGASAIELSIVAPLFLLLIFVLIQGALLLYARNVALSAAREGASDVRLFQPAEWNAAVHDGVRQNIVEYVAVVGNQTLRAADARIEHNYGASGRVRVTVSGQAISLLPGIDLEVERTATMEIEQFEADVPADER